MPLPTSVKAISELVVPGLHHVTWNVGEDQPKIAVLAVHGRGQSTDFMREQATRFGVLGVKYFAPQAPGDTWYPLGFKEPFAANEPKLSESLGFMASMIDLIRADGFAIDHIVLWGFSQGACVLSHFAVTQPEHYAGLIMFTGGFIGPDALPSVTGSVLAGVPAVLRSVDEDPWVPMARVVETAELLTQAGATVDLRIDGGTEHGITDEAAAAGAALLAALA